MKKYLLAVLCMVSIQAWSKPMVALNNEWTIDMGSVTTLWTEDNNFKTIKSSGMAHLYHKDKNGITMFILTASCLSNKDDIYVQYRQLVQGKIHPLEDLTTYQHSDNQGFSLFKAKMCES